MVPRPTSCQGPNKQLASGKKLEEEKCVANIAESVGNSMHIHETACECQRLGVVGTCVTCFGHDGLLSRETLSRESG